MSRALGLLFGLSLLCACSDDTQPVYLDKGPGKTDGKSTVDGKPPATCGTTALLPADSVVADYKRKSDPDVAADPSSLQAIVDGGSEKYTNNKFICLSRVIYTSNTTGAEIEIWAFDQTDQAGAKGAFDIATSAMTDLTPLIGEASKENTSAVNIYEAFARKGKTLVRVAANKKTVAADAKSMLTAVITAAP